MKNNSSSKLFNRRLFFVRTLNNKQLIAVKLLKSNKTIKMTTQHQIITICVLAFIGVPLGTFTIIKTINKLSRPPVNTLHRSGDIELVDYIEQGYSHPDLLQSPPRIYDRVGSYWSGWSSNPPSYQTVDRFYINSSFEDNINLDFIWIILLVFIIVMILFNKPINNFRISSKNISTQEIPYTKNISTQEISYTKIYQQVHKGKYFTYGKHYSYVLFHAWTIFDIKNWISTFDDIDYAVTVELIGESYPDFNNNEPRLILSWEFIVNKGSCPLLISTHIKNQSDKLIDLFDLEFDNNYSEYPWKPSILLSFTELYCSK